MKKRKWFKELGAFGGIFALTLGCRQFIDLVQLPGSGGQAIAAQAVGVGTTILKNFLGSLNSILDSKVGASFSKIQDVFKKGINHDLEQSFITAYEDSFNQIEKEFLENIGLQELMINRARKIFNTRSSNLEYSRKRIKEFFKKLSDLFSDNEEIQNMLSVNGQMHMSEYLTKIIQDAAVIWDTDDFSRLEFEEFVIARLPVYFNNNFLAELKINEKAKTAYFKHMLELNILYAENVKREIESLNQIAVQSKNSLAQIFSELKSFQRGNNLQLQKISELNFIISERLALLESKLSHVAILLDKRVQIPSALDVEKNNVNYDKGWLPFLSSNIINVKNPSMLFNFKARYTNFICRNEQMSSLLEFLHSPELFSWWMIIGRGGMGKSRLAQEFNILAKQAGFYAGFYDLSNEQITSWHDFKSPLPTLLILDYADSNIDKVEKLIKSLFNLTLCGSMANKTRILLINRVVSEEWELKQNGIELTESAFNDKTPLEIIDKNDDLQLGVLRQIAEKSPYKNDIQNQEANIIASLNKLDKYKTPLFAFIAADLLSRTGQITNWEKTDMLQSVLDRLENDLWSRFANYAKHKLQLKKLVLFTTIVRWIKREQLQGIALKKFGLAPDDLEPLFAMLNVSKDPIILGMQPDILGEYFIIKTSDYLLKEDTETFNELFKFAWAFRPETCWWTFSLLFDDFSVSLDNEFKIMKSFILNVSNYDQEDKEVVGHFCLLMTNIINRTKNSSVSDQIYLPIIKAIFQKFPDSPATGFSYFLSLKKIYIDSDRPRSIERIEEMLNLAEKITITSDNTETCDLLLLEAMLVYFKLCADDRKSECYWKVFRKLSDCNKYYPNNEVIATLVIANFVHLGYVGEGLPINEDNEMQLNVILTPLRSFPENNMIQFCTLDVLYNMLFNTISKSQSVVYFEQHVFSRINYLLEKKSLKENVSERFAHILKILIIVTGQARYSSIRGVNYYYSLLHKIQIDVKKSISVARCFSEALASLIGGAPEDGTHYPKVKLWFDKIVYLGGYFDNDEEIVKYANITIWKVFRLYLISSRPNVNFIKQVLAQLDMLAFQGKNDVKVAQYYADSLSCLSQFLVKNNVLRIISPKQCLERVSELDKRFPHDEVIIERLIFCLSNVLVNDSVNGTNDFKLEYCMVATSFIDAFPDSQKISLQLLEFYISMLTVEFNFTKNDAVASYYFEFIAKLMHRFPNDEKIVRRSIVGFELITCYFERNDISKENLKQFFSFTASIFPRTYYDKQLAEIYSTSMANVLKVGRGSKIYDFTLLLGYLDKVEICCQNYPGNLKIAESYFAILNLMSQVKLIRKVTLKLVVEIIPKALTFQSKFDKELQINAYLSNCLLNLIIELRIAGRYGRYKYLISTYEHLITNFALRFKKSEHAQWVHQKCLEAIIESYANIIYPLFAIRWLNFLFNIAKIKWFKPKMENVYPYWIAIQESFKKMNHYPDPYATALAHMILISSKNNGTGIHGLRVEVAKLNRSALVKKTNKKLTFSLRRH